MEVAIKQLMIFLLDNNECNKQKKNIMQEVLNNKDNLYKELITYWENNTNTFDF
jgi:hypothetical protein